MTIIRHPTYDKFCYKHHFESREVIKERNKIYGPYNPRGPEFVSHEGAGKIDYFEPVNEVIQRTLDINEQLNKTIKRNEFGIGKSCPTADKQIYEELEKNSALFILNKNIIVVVTKSNVTKNLYIYDNGDVIIENRNSIVKTAKFDNNIKNIKQINITTLYGEDVIDLYPLNKKQKSNEAKANQLIEAIKNA